MNVLLGKGFNTTMKQNIGNIEPKLFLAGGILSNLICKVKLLYIKRCDAFNNATLGTHLGFGASFADIPHLPHGLYGIVVTHNAVIGKNVTIYHQVTIGQGKNGHLRLGMMCKLVLEQLLLEMLLLAIV